MDHFRQTPHTATRTAPPRAAQAENMTADHPFVYLASMASWRFLFRPTLHVSTSSAMLKNLLLTKRSSAHVRERSVLGTTGIVRRIPRNSCMSPDEPISRPQAGRRSCEFIVRIVWHRTCPVLHISRFSSKVMIGIDSSPALDSGGVGRGARNLLPSFDSRGLP